MINTLGHQWIAIIIISYFLLYSSAAFIDRWTCCCCVAGPSSLYLGLLHCLSCQEETLQEVSAKFINSQPYCSFVRQQCTVIHFSIVALRLKNHSTHMYQSNIIRLLIQLFVMTLQIAQAVLVHQYYTVISQVYITCPLIWCIYHLFFTPKEQVQSTVVELRVDLLVTADSQLWCLMLVRTRYTLFTATRS